jgi:hypothetical protein
MQFLFSISEYFEIIGKKCQKWAIFFENAKLQREFAFQNTQIPGYLTSLVKNANLLSLFVI